MKFKYQIEMIFVLALVAAFLILWQGRSSPFILDDLLHFPRLSGGVTDWDTALRWIFGGSSATGRPISYLSFLLNDIAWPSSPESFKGTNIFIHLLNGVLVFILSRSLLNAVENEIGSRRTEFMAVLVMALWLISPIHQSAIFMAIQRMTLLMSTFMLLALICYVKGRVLIGRGQLSMGYWFITLGIGVLGPMAAFSKDPGILVCAYVIVLEATVFKSISWSCRWGRYWRLVFLYVPMLMIVGYYLFELVRMEQLYLKRDFDMGERLMTEARILLVYLSLFLAPRLSAIGPYQDDFLISRGFFEPVTTAIAILVILSLLFGAIKYRTRYPVVAFGILWFFSGHLLESTALPLELYFEHRNYLPMLGPIIALVYYLKLVPEKVKKLTAVAVTLYLAFVAGISFSYASQWADSDERVNVWAYYHPGSVRAQLDATRYWLDRYDIQAAKKQVSIALQYRPGDAGMNLYAYLVNNCKPKYGENIPLAGELKDIVPIAPFDHASISAIQFLRENIATGRCEVSYDTLISIIHLYLSNPKFYGVDASRASLYQELSAVYAAMGDFSKTLESLDNAYEARPLYNIALNQAYLAETAGNYELAKQFIDKARSSPTINKYEWFWRNKEIDEWEAKLLGHAVFVKDE